MARKEELENMILTDLVAECEAKGIAVGDDPTADMLRDKLLEPVEPVEPVEPEEGELMGRREELENMILPDLVAECEAKGIAVGDDPTADMLRDKLLEPVEPSEPTEPEPEA